MANSYHDGLWSRYMYNVSIDGMTKCFKELTLNQLTGNAKLNYHPFGEDSVLKCRRLLYDRIKCNKARCVK